MVAAFPDIAASYIQRRAGQSLGDRLHLQRICEGLGKRLFGRRFPAGQRDYPRGGHNDCEQDAVEEDRGGG